MEFRSGYNKQDPETIIKYYNNVIVKLKEEHKASLDNQQKVLKNTLTWKLGRIFVSPFALLISLLVNPKKSARSKKGSPGVLSNPVKSKEQANPRLLSGDKNAGKVSQQTLKTSFPDDNNGKPNIACILDEFTYSSFKPDANLITFTPDNWEYVLENVPLDALFVESAWKGNFGAWQYKIAKYANQDNSQLLALIKWCNLQNIPTLFWNKEDPIHFEKFIDTAKLFDYIFTTDQDIINDYKEKAGHDKVFALPFAAQPLLHNPIKIMEERIPQACFAGSYYSNRHEERRGDMERVLDVAARFGLVIYDRNYEQNKIAPTHMKFPERYDKYILGSLKYNQIDTAYKGYKIMINVNSVKNSPTMFSRRVFEGLACGTPVVSTYSEGINRLFRGIVTITEDEKDLEMNFKKLLTEEDTWDRISILGIRKVLSEHTYKHRLNYVLGKIGKEHPVKTPQVAIVSVVTSRQDLDDILPYCKAQQYENIKYFFFLEKFEGYEDVLNEYNDGKFNSYIHSYLHNYDNIQQIVASDYLAYFSGKHFYSSGYITDLALASGYCRSEIITKPALFRNENNKLVISRKLSSYTYQENALPSMSIISPGQFSRMPVKTALAHLVSDKSYEVFFRSGARIFAIDGYNFIWNGSRMDMQEKRKVII
jgi:spore maturation protein CgeB